MKILRIWLSLYLLINIIAVEWKVFKHNHKTSNNFIGITYIISGDEMFALIVLIVFSVFGYFKYLQIDEDE